MRPDHARIWTVKPAGVEEDRWRDLVVLLDEAESARAGRFKFEADHRAYVLARAGELKFWTAELTPQDLITPGIATFLPIWALILSLLIWSRHAINRNA